MKGLTKLSLVGAIGALVALSAYAQSYSIGGTDWLFDVQAQLVVTGQITTTIPVNQTGVSVTINQSNNNFDSQLNDATIPVSFPPYITTTLPTGFFVIGGNNGVRGFQFIAGPISLPASDTGLPLDIRIRNISLNLAGIITGNNTAITDSFGTRVYEITGIPSPTPFNTTNPFTSWGRVGNIEAFPPIWLNIGSANLEIQSWRLYRPVPEPASLLALGSGLASLVALRRRKQ